jgi:energy-coupling factor transporter ATP-binding protein EcfA2
MQNLELSSLAKLAVHYVNNTRENVFLTGKAGSGKTTLLKYIVENTYKNTAVVAPTGIAAINAGGVSLHSLLQLPIGSFIPEDITQAPVMEGRRFYTPKVVLSEQRLSKEKRKLLQSLELLIIDEVSMLRADLLDCADLILRYVRSNRRQAFGGVQVLFIGDLNQLPPIIRPEEWNVLAKFYSTIFFFGAKVLKDKTPVFVELDKIYRQSDLTFITLLNRLRDNQLIEADIDLLNKHYQHGFSADVKEGYIYITTHNHKADTINARELQKLTTPLLTFEAAITGEFPEHLYPCAQQLELKEGAQVMFIKNEKGENPRYFNGKIGKITMLSEDKIGVKTEDEKIIFLGRLDWENKRYTLNKNTGETEEEIIGIFTQYPLKLAWSITVHKSQGLTFTKAILDLVGSFAPGQMYVALSRLTGLQGLVLASAIPKQNSTQDPVLQAFNKNKPGQETLQENLEKARNQFFAEYTQHAFDLKKWEILLKNHLYSFDKAENLSNKQSYQEWTKNLLTEFEPLQGVAERFQQQILKILHNPQTNNLPKNLQERVSKAKEYFLPLLDERIQQIRQHKQKAAEQKKVKGYLQELAEIEQALIMIKKDIIKVELLLSNTVADRLLTKEMLQQAAEYQAENQNFAQSQKINKVSTHEVTLRLFQAGKNVEEIAEERGLNINTIETHIAHFVELGLIPVSKFLAKQDMEVILEAAKKLETDYLSPIKEHLEATHPFEYLQIRMAIAHKKYLEKLKETD